MKRWRIRFGLILISLFLSTVTVGFAKSYERIVSLAPSITEILFTIGAGDRIVGVTTYCDYPEEAKTKPKVGGFTDQNIEAIVLQKPDLVILTPNRGTKFTYEKLKQINIETLVVPFYSLDDLLKSFELISQKAGNILEAKKIQAQLLETINQVRNQSVSRPKKKVAFVSWHTPLILAAGGTLEGNVVELTGGMNIAQDSPLHYPKFNIEALFTRDPDLIIDTSRMGRKMDFESQKEMVKKFWGQYSELHAVKTGHVYMFKGNVYCAPGPRTVRMIQAVNAILDPSTKPQNEFYERIQF